ncbi:hypothetical protein YPPY53_2054, partial [Yersinia pestis PY-53]
MLLNIRERND